MLPEPKRAARLEAGAATGGNMTNRLLLAVIPLAIALAAGCTTMGSGFGSTAAGTNPVSFTWKSSDDVSGSMTALAQGKTYTGQFFQITSDTTVDQLGPLWTGWGRGGRLGPWYDWDAGPQFVTHYSGKVVANLSEPGGAHMRCRFQLVHPADGRAGGGRGECQLPDGARIDAQFPQA
jgi:hypothetical protein